MDTKKLRQKILDLAIHGRLVPQDPNDEPASVLLERIRAEKEQLIKEGRIKAKKKAAKADETTAGQQNVPFEVPDGWCWCRLDDLAFYKKGPFGSSLTKSMFVPDSPNAYKVYEQKNAISKDSTLGHYFIDKDKYEELKGFAVQPEDIIVSCAGTIGETYVLPPNIREGIINQALMIIRLFDKSISDFYLLYFDFILKSKATKESKGTAIKNIPPFDILKNFFIPLPPQKEQIRIIEKVSYWLSFVDTIDHEESEMSYLISRTKSKILDLAIHGKLVPQDPNDEPASKLLKRINPKAERICNNEQYGKVPKGWALCHINDVASSSLGKTLDKGRNVGCLQNYLCALNVQWGYFDLSKIKQFRLEEDELQRYLVRKGDLLVCEGGDVGRAAIWNSDSEFYYQNALHRIRFKENISGVWFMYHLKYLKEKGIIDESCKGVTIKHLTQSVLNSLYFHLPPLPEQHRIVAKIEELFAQLDKIESALQA